MFTHLIMVLGRKIGHLDVFLDVLLKLSTVGILIAAPLALAAGIENVHDGCYDSGFCAKLF